MRRTGDGKIEVTFEARPELGKAFHEGLLAMYSLLRFVKTRPDHEKSPVMGDLALVISAGYNQKDSSPPAITAIISDESLSLLATALDTFNFNKPDPEQFRENVANGIRMLLLPIYTDMMVKEIDVFRDSASAEEIKA